MYGRAQVGAPRPDAHGPLQVVAGHGRPNPGITGAVPDSAESGQPNPGTDSNNPFASLPSFQEVISIERAELFRTKLSACSMVFDFNSELYQEEKEAKRQTLLEILEYANNSGNCFSECVIPDCVSMVAANIFRSLPKKHRGIMSIYDPDDEEPALELAWQHLHIVYEFFLRFIVSNDVDPKSAKRIIDGNFVLKLLELFDSEDPRERDYLKTILHRVYGKFMALRSFIRRAIEHVFLKVIYECEVHNGVGELLEILGSIISGFALPLKDEHKDFLINALIPLHKVKFLVTFHQQLSYCMTQYMEKDSRLAANIIESMLKFWPVSLTSKQVLFLNELEETLELTQPPEFNKFKEALFKRIASCISSSHFQIAERALFLWNNDYIVKLINQNRQCLFPIIIGSLYDNSKNHWNVTIHKLTFNVLKLLLEADPDLFNECTVKSRAECELEDSEKDTRLRHWDAIAKAFDEAHADSTAGAVTP